MRNVKFRPTKANGELINMSEWTDELKQEVIEAYEAQEPTGETSIEICKELAEKYEKTPNGIRQILTRAGVYVKKEAGAAKPGASSGDKPKRVSKADAIADLKAAISDGNQELDEEILDKLTGKAAVYLTGVVRGILGTDEEE